MPVVHVQCPWFPQRDNVHEPWGTCNLTSVAMVLAALGIAGDGSGQLEDQLYREARRRGRDHHSERTMQELIEWKGRKDRFTYMGTWEQLRAHLDGGGLGILHGWFTPSGHIVVVCGYDSDRKEWIVNDPAGEWTRQGYGKILNGAARRYSYRLLDCVGRAASYSQAMSYYDARLVIPVHQKELWLHLVSR